MTLAGWLNSEMDLARAGALARQGLGWWLGELRGLLPGAWRERLTLRPRTWIEPKAAGGWRLWRDGRPVQGLAAAGRPAKVGVLIPEDLVLVRHVVAPPRMSAGDLRAMLALDIDRLSPLAPDLIHFDVEIGEPSLSLAILPRETARRLVLEARRDGFAPTALALKAEDRTRFEFLPQTLRDLGEGGSDRARLYGWLAAGALILLNVALLVGRDMVQVSRLQSLVDAQKPTADAVLRLRRRVGAEDARRRDLLVQGRRADPLPLLSALTQALPPGVAVRRLEWNGESLHITGVKPADIDMAAAVRGTGLLATPRTTPPTDTPADGAPADESSGDEDRTFDLTADARPDPRP